MAEFEDQLNRLLSNPTAMSQIMQLAQSLDTNSPPPQPAPQPPPEHAGNGSFNNIDPALLQLFPLVQELGNQENSHAKQLLYALRPYLKTDRQNKVDRALQLARLFTIGKKFLAKWEG